MTNDIIFSKKVQGYRVINLPPEHMISEFIAFPLASTAAFQTNITRFDPNMKEACTKKLWRTAECQLLKAFPDFSIDQAVYIRDRLWFNSPYDAESKVPMHDFLPRIAEQFLEAHGQYATPRDGFFVNHQESAAQHITDEYHPHQTLRWLSFAIPKDLLIGALQPGNTPPKQIHNLTDRLHKILKDQGVAESHLHLGAVLNFSDYWIATLHALGSHLTDEKSFSSPGADFNEGEYMAGWLIRAAIVRCILAYFLYAKNHFPIEKNFRSYFYEEFLPETAKQLSATQAEIARICIKEFMSGKSLYSDPLYSEMRQLYREIAPTIQRPFPGHPNYLHFHDPIAKPTGYLSIQHPIPEILFVNQAIAYLKDREKKEGKDKYFETLFWQTIRIRCIYYRHVVQRPLVPGLQWFVRTYSRMGPGKKTVSLKYLPIAAAKMCSYGQGLRSLEVRKAPEASTSENLKMITDIIEGIRSVEYHRKKIIIFDGLLNWDLNDLEMQPADSKHAFPSGNHFEFGIVYHISRSRGKDAEKGLPGAFSTRSEASPQTWQTGQAEQTLQPNSFRYDYYYREKRQEALAISRLFLNFPRSIKTIRGIDLCTDELGIPTWVLAPLIRFIRDSGKEAAKHLAYKFNESVKAPKMTVHAGEDFIHLLGGLRRIDEAINYFRLKPGDRIGHGIALGINPEQWALRMSKIAIPREERLLDLAWEWIQYSQNSNIPFQRSRIIFLEKEISRLSGLIFGQMRTPLEMQSFIDCLHNENALKSTGYPDMIKIEEDNSSEFDPVRILSGYLWKPDIFKAGQEVEWIDVIAEIESMKMLQKNLREKIGKIGLVIEINPSSNLLIGNFADLRNHPMWRLRPPVDTGEDLPVLSVCVGSDDPLTFATNLSWEYELLKENLVSGGLSYEQACDWIDKVRKTGIESRFTYLGNRPEQQQEKNLFAQTSLPTSCYASDIGNDIEPMP